MTAEHGISVDHATIHRWTVRYAPELLERSNQRKRPAGRKWHMTKLRSKFAGVRRISFAPSTAMATQSSSGSASGAIWLRPNAP
jgi:transposase-like protein